MLDMERVIIILVVAGALVGLARGVATARPSGRGAARTQQWRALLRPIRFESPVPYVTLGTSIRECVAAGAAGSPDTAQLVQHVLDSRTTTFDFGAGGPRGFRAMVVCEPEGTGSRGRLEVRAVGEPADAAVVRALVRLRERVSDGVRGAGGRMWDGG